jgi:predicted acylesterase/phospholipase RssA
MSQNVDVNTPVVALDDLNLVGGAGGSRAILATSGAILACHQAGLSKWRTLGGASGGSIPTFMLAAGVQPAQLVRMTIEMDFASKLTRHASIFKILLAYLMKDRYEKTRPRHGVLSSEKLGEFIDSFTTTWPENYWTVAAVGKTQWLFKSDGIYEYTAEGMRRLTDTPPPVGLAVRASCAIPGIIDAVPYKLGDRVRYLFDGALGIDGRCPIGVVKRNFGQPAARIIACDVGEDRKGKHEKRIRRMWKLICGEGCLSEPEGETPRHAEGVVLVKAKVTSVRSLQFTLSRDQKWEAVMSGYAGAVPQLAAAGLLSGAKLSAAEEICRSFQALLKEELAEGELANRIEKLLAGHGLY